MSVAKDWIASGSLSRSSEMIGVYRRQRLFPKFSIGLFVREAFGTVDYGKNYAAVNLILYLFAAVSPWFLGHVFDYHQSYAAGLVTLFILQIVAAVLILPNVNSAEVSP